VLETVLYYEAGREDELERFYGAVLGLRPLGRGRWSLAYRLGAGVYLLFEAERSSTQAQPPPHGANGAIHTCFLAPAAEYERWKEHLAAHEVPLLDEITWESGVRSFYFHDPAGNVLEIAEDDMWARQRATAALT
jgi:catechol-2,3-dioxygenase